MGPGPPDADVLFELTTLSWDGSVRHVISGYRPQYVVNSNYHTSVQHRFVDAESVFTGQKVKAHVWFITPEAYPHSLWEGLVLDVAEGAKVVGRATILKVHNPLLRRADEPEY